MERLSKEELKEHRRDSTIMYLLAGVFIKAEKEGHIKLSENISLFQIIAEGFRLGIEEWKKTIKGE
jgi:hypothetical protein|tara:strand:+ start:9962 stop:10159 length:198 start_codon:yes stop_codon:yes gene_type:complete